jgi:hypothetical protein
MYCEIKSRIAMAKAAFNKKGGIFTGKMDLELRKKVVFSFNNQSEVTGRRGRRRRKLLDDLMEMKGYCHLKEEAISRTMWRAGFGSGFGSGFGPVVRRTAE